MADWNLMQGATLPAISGTCQDALGAPVSLVTATAVTASMWSVLNPAIAVFLARPVTVDNAPQGHWICPWQAQDSVNVGLYNFAIHVTFPTGVEIFPQGGYRTVQVFEAR